VLRFTIDGHYKEDAAIGIKILAAMADSLPNAPVWEEDEPVKECSCEPPASAEEPFTMPNMGSVVEPTEAREAEQALMKEAVAGSGKWRRGRQAKAMEAAPEPVAEETKPSDDDNGDLLDLLATGNTTASTSITEAVVAEMETKNEDDIMSLLGGGNEAVPAKDEYDDMDHDTLYNQIRDRMTGRLPTKSKIIGTWLGECIREAKQRDKKADTVSNFSDLMLRQLLRGADAGTEPVNVFMPQ
jgi:hypothetical protein